MTDSIPSFDERKTSRWVWLVPSVLLHVVVLLVWLSMPEEPPRQPGQREMVVAADQAERLQELVEDTNLRALRAQVAEMQAIKERMTGMRAEKMEGLQSFETAMLTEAPGDVADLISEILKVQDSARDLGERSLWATEQLLELSGPVEELLEKDPAAAARELKTLLSVRDTVAGGWDQLEDEVGTSTAIVGSIRRRMEWIHDQDLLDRLEEFFGEVESMNGSMNELRQQIGRLLDGRPRRLLGELVEEEESVVATFLAYEEMVKSDETKLAREKTEEELQNVKKELAALREELEANRARLDTLPGGERSRMNRTIRGQERSIGGLTRNIRRLEQSLEQNGYFPDNNLRQENNRLKHTIRQALHRPSDTEVFERFLERQAAFVLKANELRTSLEAM